MKEANELIGMVKYAAERSGSKYVIGREDGSKHADVWMWSTGMVPT